MEHLRKTQCRQTLSLTKSTFLNWEVEVVIINPNRWTSLEAWIEHGKTDWSVNARAELVPLLNWLVIMKAGRKFTGFTRKWTWDELVE